jgi:hypothetical protein
LVAILANTGETVTRAIVKFNAHPRGPRRRPPSIIKELLHAKEQLYLQSQYPGREQSYPDLPESEFSPWPRVDDDKEE